MKTERSKFMVSVIVILLLLLVFFVTYLFVAKSGKKEISETVVEDERTLETINVVASNGKFEPSNIETELFGDVDLVITAKDADYQFKIEGYPRFDTDIKKGESQKIQLYSLGIGEYSYDCGVGCSGKVMVNQRPDDDE